jgi:hypothetical protein
MAFLNFDARMERSNENNIIISLKNMLYSNATKLIRPTVMVLQSQYKTNDRSISVSTEERKGSNDIGLRKTDKTTYRFQWKKIPGINFLNA